jgi:hypothetical protein
MMMRTSKIDMANSDEPADIDTFIKSLTAIGAHEHQRFNKLRGTVVSHRIFIRSQSLIAR